MWKFWLLRNPKFSNFSKYCVRYNFLVLLIFHGLFLVVLIRIFALMITDIHPRAYQKSGARNPSAGTLHLGPTTRDPQAGPGAQALRPKGETHRRYQVPLPGTLWPRPIRGALYVGSYSWNKCAGPTQEDSFCLSMFFVLFYFQGGQPVSCSCKLISNKHVLTFSVLNHLMLKTQLILMWLSAIKCDKFYPGKAGSHFCTAGTQLCWNEIFPCNCFGPPKRDEKVN